MLIDLLTLFKTIFVVGVAVTVAHLLHWLWYDNDQPSIYNEGTEDHDAPYYQ